MVSQDDSARYGCYYFHYISEEGQHLIVGSLVSSQPTNIRTSRNEKPPYIIRDEEADVGLIQDRCDSDQAGATARDDGNVLPGVLAVLALPVVLVVKMSDSLPQGLDSSGWRILSAGDTDVYMRWPLETAFDIIFNLGKRVSRGQ